VSGLSGLTANQGGSNCVTSPARQAVQGRDSRPTPAAWLDLRGNWAGRGHRRPNRVGAKEAADRKVSTEPCSTIPK
jgi:hypothetical protein